MAFSIAVVRYFAGFAATVVLAIGLAFPSFAQRNLTAIPSEASIQRVPSAATEKRIALVIGNNAYREAKLTAPINDARAMATALTELGFKVV